MKMNKKGFTLIELLAVIVILAVVALVATPIILASVSNAKKQAAMASANNVITAINYNEQMAAFEASDIVGQYTSSVNKTFIAATGSGSTAQPAISGIDSLSSTIKFSGDKPNVVNLFVEVSDDDEGAPMLVTNGCMNISGYDVEIKGGKAESAKAAKYSSTANENDSTCKINGRTIEVTTDTGDHVYPES